MSAMLDWLDPEPDAPIQELPEWEQVKPKEEEPRFKPAEGFARLRRLGSAGFGTPDPTGGRTEEGNQYQNPYVVPDLERIAKRQMDARRQMDLFALAVMGAGFLFLFIGLWVWLGFGVALTTLGLGLLGLGFWVAYDNSRPAKKTPNTSETKK